ncbi:MAG: aminotransferase class V-fold PLP-dependent enzyme [Sphingobacterium sp.]|jgi:UDP-sulfoquinovose synthase|nr:aminotransferase class V-fold PLP-dependent enzyme [Sphingobacterium sp.]
MNGTILILGAEGYLGWPLAMKLALHHPDQKIILLDNGWRKSTVANLGFGPWLQIPHLSSRIEVFGQKYGLANMCAVHAEVCSDELAELIRRERPHTIYHLAQQCSASYSMLGLQQALYTIRNNEEGNMRLLWAVREYVPQAHIIKLGSFGEYAKGGLPIAEGYFKPGYQGQLASTPLPYPRAANDIYHVSKINDSNYVAMAARTWGLRITEVMQATVFGLLTSEMDASPDLFTRFDYDPIFGTVANRFIAQVVSGSPMTVYGSGNQRTGLMALNDAVNSLARFAVDIPPMGEHRVVNHVTETHYSINELAADIADIARGMGLDPKISFTSDLRGESAARKPIYSIETSLQGSHLYHTDFHTVIRESISLLQKQYSTLLSHHFSPHSAWNECSDGINLDPKRVDAVRKIENEAYWDQIRNNTFPSARVNLNPGCLATLPQDRLETIKNQVNGNPLSLYALGREAFNAIQEECAKVWPAIGYRCNVTSSTSQAMNLLALVILRRLQEDGKRCFQVLTSEHEHPGGIGPFEHLPEYKLTYLPDVVLNDTEEFNRCLREMRPDIVFLSHVYYPTGKLMQDKWRLSNIKKAVPNAILILDVAQSLGIQQLPFGDADVLIGSTHKWLHGPLGGGLAWFKEDFANWIGALYWNKQHLFEDPQTHGFSIPGGQDFLLYERLRQSLKRYREIGPKAILDRSTYLAAYLKRELNGIFGHAGITHCFMGDDVSPVVSLLVSDYDPYPLYEFLRKKDIHIKCIKHCRIEAKVGHVLRFGLPYYENMGRLRMVLDTIASFVDCAIMDKQEVELAV